MDRQRAAPASLLSMAHSLMPGSLIMLCRPHGVWTGKGRHQMHPRQTTGKSCRCGGGSIPSGCRFWGGGQAQAPGCRFEGSTPRLSILRTCRTLKGLPSLFVALSRLRPSCTLPLPLLCPPSGAIPSSSPSHFDPSGAPPPHPPPPLPVLSPLRCVSALLRPRWHQNAGRGRRRRASSSRHLAHTIRLV